MHNHCPHPHQILELMPLCVLNKRIISARANGATISAGRKAAQVMHVPSPGPHHGEGLDRLHRAASPHHVKGARGMGARAAGAGKEPAAANKRKFPPPARSAPSHTNNADRRHVRRGATHGDRSVHTHRPPTQPPEARGQKAQEKKFPRRDVAGAAAPTRRAPPQGGDHTTYSPRRHHARRARCTSVPRAGQAMRKSGRYGKPPGTRQKSDTRDTRRECGTLV